MIVYIDTSACAKLVVEEPESDALAAFCDRPDVELVSTLLLETEMMRLGWREEIPSTDITAALAQITIHNISRAVFTHAGRFPHRHLRSLDALHVAGALRIGADAILVYDQRLSDAAEGVGLQTLAPTS